MREAHGRPSTEDVVVGALDLVEDLFVEAGGRAQAIARGGVDEGYAAFCASIQCSRPFDFPREQVADRFVHDPAAQPLGIDAEPVQGLRG
jgi:hypothetical protein